MSRMEVIAPINPESIANRKTKGIRASTIEAFNELIAQNFVENKSSVDLDEVKAVLVKRGFNSQRVSGESLLRLTALYKRNGWDVQHINTYRSSRSLEIEPEHLIFTPSKKQE
jgi:hypothetical protein